MWGVIPSALHGDVNGLVYIFPDVFVRCFKEPDFTGCFLVMIEVQMLM